MLVCVYELGAGFRRSPTHTHKGASGVRWGGGRGLWLDIDFRVRMRVWARTLLENTFVDGLLVVNRMEIRRRYYCTAFWSLSLAVSSQ